MAVKRAGRRNAPSSPAEILRYAKEQLRDIARQAKDARDDMGNSRSYAAQVLDGIILQAERAATSIGNYAATSENPRGGRSNPPLTVFALANPPRGAKLMSDHLYTIKYRHHDNGRNYFHDFRPGTQMHALADGSIRISRPGARVWGEFPPE